MSDPIVVPCDACRRAKRITHPRQEYNWRLWHLEQNNGPLGPQAATSYLAPQCFNCKRENMSVSLCLYCYSDRMEQHNMIGPLDPTKICQDCWDHSYLIIPCTPHAKDDFPEGVCKCDPDRLARYEAERRRQMDACNPFMK